MTYDVDSISRSVPLNVKHVEQREGNSSKNYFCVRNLDIFVYLFHNSYCVYSKSHISYCYHHKYKKKKHVHCHILTIDIPKSVSCF